MTTTVPRTAAPVVTGYRHEALLWHGVEELLARTVPFVTEAVHAGQPVMVALVAEHWAPLRSALGAAADEVDYVDMEVLGRNPARIIPAWREFVARHPQRPLRGIAGPVWAGRREAELAECHVHEHLLNLAVPPEAGLWLLCCFDAERLDPAVLTEVEGSHPVVVGRDTAPSSRYDPVVRHRALTGRPLAPPRGPVVERTFEAGDLAALRALAVDHAARAGLPRNRTQDLALAVSELASNSVDHGGGRGGLRLWVEDGALVIEVADDGLVTDPLAGRHTPSPIQARGRGLWLVNRLCDLVQIRSVPGEGTVVRVTTWL